MLKLIARASIHLSSATILLIIVSHSAGVVRPHDYLAYKAYQAVDDLTIFLVDVPLRLTVNLSRAIPDDIMPTTMHCNETSPSWSADGRLAFVRYCDTTGDILILDLKTLQLTNFTHSPVYDHSPAWSPDGRIAFTAQDGVGRIGLYVGDPTTQAIVPVLSGQAVKDDLSWSPSGDLAFLGYTVNANVSLFVRDAQSEVRAVVAEYDGFRAPVWSPQGKMTYTVGYITAQIFQYDEELQKWTPASVPASMFGPPVWSPDGKLTFVGDQAGNNDIYQLDVQSGELTNLTQHPADDVEGAWSADGRLAFFSYRDNQLYPRLFVLDVASGTLTALSGEINAINQPVWSR